MTMAQMLCVAVVDDADNDKHKQQFLYVIHAPLDGLLGHPRR